MKTISCFIMLVVGSVALVLFGPYYLGMWMAGVEWMPVPLKYNGAPYWLDGFIAVMIIILISMLVYAAILATWELAKRLTKAGW